jgi:hypothetical protein
MAIMTQTIPAATTLPYFVASCSYIAEPDESAMNYTGDRFQVMVTL